MVCVSQEGGIICTSPYDPMYPSEYESVVLSDDIICGTSTIFLWGAGIALGYLIADRFTTMLGRL